MSIEGLADALLAPVALKRLTVESEARNAVPDAGSGPSTVTVRSGLLQVPSLVLSP
jgi:hypothetical protein